MRQRFDSEQPYGGRIEYTKQPMDVQLDEGILITDMLDDFLESSHISGTATASNVQSDVNGYSNFRSFQYLDVDPRSKIIWPLNEKTIDIRHLRPRNTPYTEQYQVVIATRIHQTRISKEPILNVYEISYFGDKESVTITIDEPDIIGESEVGYTTRPTTSYDNEVLFTELGYLRDMLLTQERKIVSDQLNK